LEGREVNEIAQAVLNIAAQGAGEHDMRVQSAPTPIVEATLTHAPHSRRGEQAGEHRTSWRGTAKLTSKMHSLRGVRRHACAAPAPGVSITRSAAIGGLAARFSSALRKAMSKPALCATAGIARCGQTLAMKHLAGWSAVDQLNRPYLDDAVAVQWVEPGCLGIDDDFTHIKFFVIF
jgi:hypothetical protein